MSTGRAVEELQEYGDNYYRWLRQGQGLEPAQTQAQGLATVVDGTSDVSNGGSEAISGNASDGDSDGDVDSLGRVDSGGGGGGGGDDASCPDIGFVFDPDGQVTHTLTYIYIQWHLDPWLSLLP